MNNIIGVIILMMTFVPVASCRQYDRIIIYNQVKASECYQKHAELKKNKKIWNRKVSSAKRIKIHSYENDGFISTPINLKQVKGYGPISIKGIITNYYELSGYKSNARTKAKIFVESVYKGDVKLKGKSVIVIMQGGLVSSDKYYHGRHNPIPKQKVYLDNVDAPLPKIGSEIIAAMDINEYKNSNMTNFDMGLKVNRISSGGSYRISIPEYTLWVKNRDTKQYEVSKKSNI
ncbi:hypothetical protein [Companilactobacillus hulinensis]|uniref:hypothetical protein n=1 Tax=Companilactobacillus hulinensis TaxID=2486007 RepID=UPI000F792A9B|nr:hypothetical protein [Companilactobacillus hulinensis]